MWVLNKLKNISSQTQIAFISVKLMFWFLIYFLIFINVKHQTFFLLLEKKRFTSTYTALNTK